MIKLCAILLALEGAVALAWMIRRDLRDDRYLAAVAAPPVDVLGAFTEALRGH